MLKLLEVVFFILVHDSNIRSQKVGASMDAPKSIKHIAYSPYFHKIPKFPPIS